MPLVELVEELERLEAEQEQDSGMESFATSKDDTPERRAEDATAPPSVAAASPDDTVCVAGCPGRKEFEDEPDETLSERLWGLTEMFPEPVRSVACSIASNATTLFKGTYGVSRNVMWIVASSSVILFAPVIFEVERAQMEEMQKSQQKQVLLGTNAALAGPMPPMPR